MEITRGLVDRVHNAAGLFGLGSHWQSVSPSDLPKSIPPCRPPARPPPSPTLPPPAAPVPPPAPLGGKGNVLEVGVGHNGPSVLVSRRPARERKEVPLRIPAAASRTNR